MTDTIELPANCGTCGRPVAPSEVAAVVNNDIACEPCWENGWAAAAEAVDEPEDAYLDAYMEDRLSGGYLED